jgi:hypothetical protein
MRSIKKMNAVMFLMLLLKRLHRLQQPTLGLVPGLRDPSTAFRVTVWGLSQDDRLEGAGREIGETSQNDRQKIK